MQAKKIKPLSDEFEFVTEGALDERKRVSLAKVLAAKGTVLEKLESDLRFQLFVNEAGQILLSPSISVPLHEAWLFKNPAALAKVREGLTQLERRKLRKLGSFAKYADDESE